MTDQSEASKLLKIGIITAFATLSFVGTTVVRVPIPATGGYFNLGDTFVMLAGLLYGPVVGALVGLIGPAVADAVGFPQFILATAMVKFCEGGAVGLIGGTSNSQNKIRPILALAVGIGILVAGYFIFEAFIYPFLAHSIPFFGVTDLKAAIAEIVPNLLQGIISAIVAFGIFWLFRRSTF
jgi:uncharacterized membrane protein